MIDGSPDSCDNSLAVRWLWGLSSWLSNSDSTVSTFSSVSLCALRLPLPRRLSTVPNFTSSQLMLIFVQPLFRTFVINYLALYHLHFDQNFVFFTKRRQKLALYCLMQHQNSRLFSVSGLKDKKLIKNKPTWKTKDANSILESFECFCQISSK